MFLKPYSSFVMSIRCKASKQMNFAIMSWIYRGLVSPVKVAAAYSQRSVSGSKIYAVITNERVPNIFDLETMSC